MVRMAIVAAAVAAAVVVVVIVVEVVVVVVVVVVATAAIIKGASCDECHQVGTETLTDKSKSVKTSLMELLGEW